MKFNLLFLLIFCTVSIANAQDSLINEIASRHKQIIQHKDQMFSGKAMDSLITEASGRNYVLIGEDHHTNEILYFTNYLTKKIDFDNYITESDQLTIDLLRKYYSGKKEAYNLWLEEYSDHFGFFTFAQDRSLLTSFFDRKKPVIGLDQVLFNEDIILFNELSKNTRNSTAKKAYENLREISRERWSKYKQNPGQKPPYDMKQFPLMLSEEMTQEIDKLLKLSISDSERQTLTAIKESNHIYTLGFNDQGLLSHQKRISLMKRNLMHHFDQIKGKKNLFKFGANHVTKYKSIFQNSPDLGNLIYNLADTEDQKSLHIAIIQKEGSTADFFSGAAKTNGLPFLKPFYDLVGEEQDWLFFDLKKINKEIKNKKVEMASQTARNYLEGYDYLIIIPKVTAQKRR